MTPRKATDDQILLAIADYDRPYAISVEEIADLVGLYSKSTVHKRLMGLRRRGLVDWLEGSPRTVHLTQSGHVHLSLHR